MPTVKLQNGKVLLKDGKVSCTCCESEPDCCMYPADMLGTEGGYTAEDLPDVLDMRLNCENIGEETIEMTRHGSTYTGAGVDFDYRIAINDDVSPKRWQISYDDGIWVPLFGESGGLCLVSEYQEACVEDQFADCYEVTWDDDGTRSATVQRISLCKWEGIDYRDQRVVLFYSDTSTEWGVQVIRGAENDEFFPDNRTKDSDQSAPDAGDGEYGGFIVEEVACP
jgi:hypothetical protein